MRVLHWYPNFLGGGGVANAVLGWSVSEARLGVDVAIAAARQSGRPLYEQMAGEPGITLIEWRPQWTFQYRGFVLRRIPRDAVRRLQSFNPDMVHVHGEFNADNLWVPRLFRCPVVLSPHGAFRTIAVTKRAGPLKALYLRIARALLYRRVGVIHTLSPAESEWVKRVLPDSRVYCLPQGPSVRTHLSGAPETESSLGSTIGFIFVGRLDVPTKGLDILLEAFAAARHQLDTQEPTLTLVGPDWKGGLAWLQRRANELGIANRIAFTGPLPAPEVVSALRRSHVYVQLSRSDCFPLSVSEALLVGKPAILSAGVGHASYPEVAALPHVRVVAPNVQDAAAAMVDFVHRLTTLSHGARDCQARVSDFFSWERVAKLQLRIYRNVIAEANGSHRSPYAPPLRSKPRREPFITSHED